jgi:C-terminal processing protease CtpA/Prc
LGAVAFVTRVAVNKTVEVVYHNPGQSNLATARLRATQDVDGLLRAIPFGNPDRRLEMPIRVEVLPSGYGYIKVTTFSENPQLLVQTWEWALKAFKEREVPGVVIDMRYNPGGFGILPGYFAGSFFSETFELYSTYRADKSGQFVRQGGRKVRPAPVRWDGPVAVLVGPECASACELFAAALARNPNAAIVGSYPTFGIAAGLFGPWLLPDGVEFNAPVIQPRAPDGGIFIENVGVLPTIKVPVTAESLLSDEDGELAAAERALREQSGR